MRFRSCLDRIDVGCIRSMVDRETFQQDPMTDEQLRSFLQEWYRKHFPDIASGEPSVAGTGQDGWQMFAWPSSSMPWRKLNIEVGETNEGLKVVNFLSAMLSPVASCNSEGAPPKDAEEKLRNIIRSLELWETDLAKYGIRGKVVGREWMPFRQAAADRRAALSKLLRYKEQDALGSSGAAP